MTRLRIRRWIALVAAIAAAMSVAASSTATVDRTRALPAPGTDPSAVDPLAVPGAFRHRDGWAVPLRAAPPDWLTPSFERRLRAAHGGPLAVPDRVATAASIERGIRPGSLMVAPYSCTTNYVFRRRGDYAIGIAGHCVDRLDQPVSLMVRNPDGDVVAVTVGRVRKRALNERGLAPDFALVRIRERLEDWVAHAITSIGGPCGTFRGGGVQTLWHYGYPLGLVGVERSGVSLVWRNAAYSWAGAAIFGDSGSPVRTGGHDAAGLLSGIILLQPGWIAGQMYGTRMTWIEDFVSRWRLALSPGCG